jgi:hypothetical protein
MFNLGIQAEKIHPKALYPDARREQRETGFFEHSELIAFSDALPDHLVVPGAGLEPAQTFRSEGF